MDTKDDKYYEAMELIGEDEFEEAGQLLIDALEIDPDYVQTHTGLVALCGNMRDMEKFNRHVDCAFDLTKKKFKKWPRRLEWIDLDNRAYLRAIQYKGEQFQERGEKDSAIELYRLLLKMNPNDNQGIRYILAGLYQDLTGFEINDMNQYGNCMQDWGELEKLVEKQNKIHKFWKKPEY